MRLAFLATQDVTGCCGGKSWRYIYDHATFSSWWSHADEHAVREQIWSRIEPGEVVLDIGAAYGSYILPALARGAAHVYAWCPETDQAEMLLRSLDANGWRGRCTIIQAGCWSADGWLEAFSGPKRPCFHQDRRDGAFPVTTLDRIVALLKIERVDWIKVDVEGAEVQVLHGAFATIHRFRPRILVENHIFKDEAIEARVARVLNFHGYGAAETIKTPPDAISHTLWLPGHVAPLRETVLDGTKALARSIG